MKGFNQNKVSLKDLIQEQRKEVLEEEDEEFKFELKKKGVEKKVLPEMHMMSNRLVKRKIKRKL
jgi:hypothetical protein